MKLYDFSQGSDEWWEVRKGIPTASEFGRIITPAKGDLAAGRTTYAAQLVAGCYNHFAYYPDDEFDGNVHTERGKTLEAEARAWVALEHEQEVREVGFCLSDCGRYGASPDGLLSNNVPVEIKCPDLHTWIKWVDAGVLPTEHKAQCHGELHVTGADRCLFVAYTATDFEPFSLWVERDSFTEKLGKCLDQFNNELADLKARIEALRAV